MDNGHPSRLEKWQSLSNKERSERYWGFIRRWSWALAIPATLVPLSALSLVPGTSVPGLALVGGLSYLTIWGALWFFGKTGPREDEKMRFPNER